MLEQIFREYLKIFPEDASRLGLLNEQLKASEQLDGKLNYTGHVTGSAIIFSPDLSKVLLIYHPSFSRWQQPGGHWDEGEAGPWLTAEREIGEEVGLNIKIKPLASKIDKRVPIDIDTHLVKKIAPLNEPDHYHHDFKYAVIADSEQIKLEDEVIKEAAWVDVGSVKHKDLVRAISKAQRLLGLKA